MTPLMSIVGRSNSGKTRLVTRLIAELKSRGYRVASIKHAQEVHFEPGKDSQQHLQAGSEVTSVVTPEQVVTIRTASSADTPEKIARAMGDDYDIILVEGFKQSSLPKIEVYRSQSGTLLEGLKRLIAIVTDEPVETNARVFSPDDIKVIADLIEGGFIKPQQNRLSVFVNGEQIPLTLFPRQIITSLLLSAVSSLKEVKKIKKLDIFLRQ